MQVSLFTLNITKATKAGLTSNHPASDVLNQTLAVDMACQKEALLAGLSGPFVALVSTPTRSLKQLLRYQYRDSMPIINTKVKQLLRYQHRPIINTKVCLINPIHVLMESKFN